MAELEPFLTQHCWQCSACKQKFDVMWRPTEKPFEPLKQYLWMFDKPTFRYCPMCGEKFEIKTENP